MERVEVTTMISGGRGMPAARAIAIDQEGANLEADDGDDGGGAVMLLGISGG